MAVVESSLAKALESGARSVPLNVFAKVSLPKTASREERATHVASLIQRVERAARATPKFYFRDADSVLQVKAPPEFVRELVVQPEVVAASEVPNFDSAMIDPVRRREVDASEIDRPIIHRRTIPRGRR